LRLALLLLSFITIIYGLRPTAPYVPNVKGVQQESWREAIIEATQFVSKLTLSEKVSLATGIGWYQFQKNTCIGNISPIPRLNFSGYCLHDSPTGVRYGTFASAFPAPVNAAQTWDRSLMYARAQAMAEEWRGKGVNIALAPYVNMARCPQAGRNWEGSGGDPYMTGEAAVQTVLGIQSQGVMASVKTILGNEQEHFRFTESSNIDDRTIHEIYAYPFMRAVQAGTATVMCSYNHINNVYACQNDRILNQILKDEFGFQGFVMSDWWGTNSGVPSVLAGLDMNMPGTITPTSNSTYFGQSLIDAVNNGSVPLSRIDDMAVRIMAPYYLLGQDKDFPPTNLNLGYPALDGRVPVMGDHYNIIRELDAASVVLLKNQGNVLPFTSKTTGGLVTYALIGSDAGPAEWGPNNCQDHGCVDGTVAQGWGSGTTNFPYLITPLEAIQQRAGQMGQTVTFSRYDWNVELAMSLASTASVAIVFSNTDSGEDGITFEGNNGDRNNLSLWENGDQLIQAVASVNSRTVVVIHTTGQVLMPWIDHPNVSAVLICGLPGQESGNSLADVLFGDVNPSGHLVYTIAKNEADYPASVLYNSTVSVPQINYTEALNIDYRWFDSKNINPLFEFGFGLSYTTFTYADLIISSVYNDTVAYKIQITVMNSGRVDGYEPPQLYLVFPESAGEPPKVLRGFERVFIATAKTESVVYYLTLMDISIWDIPTQSWVVPIGSFGVLVGASSRDIRLKGAFTPLV
jgi:beta-glucosidase